jgi:MoaA/NifB/PqqE/SkfB family radical SAM enzyme
MGYACQCNCIHCSAVKMPENTRERLSSADLKRAVEETISLGAIHFNITGGEPLLYKETLEIVEFAGKVKKSIVSIATNGILLDYPAARKLQKSGLDLVQVSIDDSIEEENDKKRGFKGAFSAALNAIANARRANLLVFISAVATNENLLNEGMDRLYALARKHNAILHINTPCTVGRWGENIYSLKKEAQDKLNLLLKLPGVRQNTEASYFTRGCKAGFEKIYITAYGDILPCQFIHISFGNIGEGSIVDALGKMQDIPYFNGKFSECLASENHEFISKYLLPLRKKTTGPYRYEKDIR